MKTKTQVIIPLALVISDNLSPAALVIALLLALSNDASLRLLGSRRWKFLQRWNYAAIFLVVLHSLGYQITENRQLPYLLLFSVIVGAVLIIQFLGFRRQKRKSEGMSQQTRI